MSSSPPSQPITLLPSFPPSLIYSRALFPFRPAVSNVQYPAVTADWDLSYTQFMSANFVGVGARAFSLTVQGGPIAPSPTVFYVCHPFHTLPGWPIVSPVFVLAPAAV